MIRSELLKEKLVDADVSGDLLDIARVEQADVASGSFQITLRDGVVHEVTLARRAEDAAQPAQT